MSCSVLVIRTRQWNGAAKQSLRLGGWLIPRLRLGPWRQASRLYLVIGSNVVLSQWADQLIAVTTEQGFPHWRAMGMICPGWVQVKNGDVAEGMSLLRGGLAASRATGAWAPHNIALLAGA